MDKLFKKIPGELVVEIVSYMIGDITKIKFIDYDFLSVCNSNYHPKYKVAIDENEQKIFNKRGRFLSRIEKIGKNLIPKIRYYLTDETIIRICSDCGKEKCGNRGCRSSTKYEYIYQSKYIGNNMLCFPYSTGNDNHLLVIMLLVYFIE